MNTLLKLGVFTGFILVASEADTFQTQLIAATIGFGLMFGCGAWLMRRM